MSSSLDSLYDLRKKFIVIGLTGRLGSGCSTTAEILSNHSFDECKFPLPVVDASNMNEYRKYKIAYNYLKENWQNFEVIHASDVITAYLLSQPLENLKTFLEKTYGDKTKQIQTIITDVEKEFNGLSIKVKQCFQELVDPQQYEYQLDENEEVVSELFVTKKLLRNFTQKIRDAFSNLQITNQYHPYQYFGDNIRKTGDPYRNDSPDPKNSYIIAEFIRRLISKIRKTHREKSYRFVIDSIRNSMEARFFKERYSSFYLFAINTEEEDRINRQSRYFKHESIKALDQEYTKNLSTEQRLYNQDIQTCIQNADIYLANPNCSKEFGDSYRELKMSLVRYLALILHPGLITPTPEERSMQIAYTAKYNSGCISRQVGAVITDASFSIKAVGWNNTAQGQTPCLLRNVNDLIHNADESAFSKYEKQDQLFRDLMEETFNGKGNSLNGRNLSFCFKDAKNCIDHTKNQVHTRSLHAEENAMLQISKYGGIKLQAGYLFTTASPCELCSKKAYQLGIKRIFYIDPYPGIANEHILTSGTKEHRPETKLFVGAIGRAYHQLFQPFMPYKDELKTLIQFDYDSSFVNVMKKGDDELRQKRIDDLKKKKEKIEQELRSLNGLTDM